MIDWLRPSSLLAKEGSSHQRLPHQISRFFQLGCFSHLCINEMPPDLSSQATAESSETHHPTKGKIAEDQGGVTALPAHVAALKNTLLDFNRFVGLEATVLVLCDEFLFGEDEGNDIPLSAYKTDGSKESQRVWERELLEDARQLAEGARKLESNFAQDVEWQKLFRRVVTSRMDAVSSFSYV
jgi:hypothetical protein